MVSNVEIAYWNLYYAYWNLYATEALLRARYETLRITETRFVAGLAESTAQDVQLARGQYEDSRSQRLQAINSILDAERSLRGMLQMRMDDGYRLVPTDEPTLAPYIPNWEQGFNEAMTLRPELYQTRQEVKALQLALVELKNQLMPDLRFFANYDINSVGNRLDGPTSENAFRELAGNHFNNWTLGLRLNVPIGFRLANANVRRAELALARAYETLKDSEAKVERNLGLQYQRIITNYELIRTTRAARLAYGEQVKTRLALLQAGKSGTLLNVVLDAQRQWADSLSQEYRFIRDYNQALVGWEYAKGTTLVRNNIQIAEGPLPSFAQIRAAEHEREKAAALKLREHPLAPCSLTDPMSSKLGVTVPPLGAPLPEVMHSMPLLKDAPPVGALPGVQPQPVLGQPVLGQPVPGQVIPGQVIPGQVIPGQLAPQQSGQPLESLPAPSTIPGDLPPVGSRNPPSTGGSSRPKRDPNAPTEFGTAGRGEEVSQPQPLPQQP
jgi:hypothetical protein